MTFRDRRDAGQRLTDALVAQFPDLRGNPSAIVIALPRGGVVLGRAIADALGIPLDIVVPRKIGAPGNEEYAIGAITEHGEPIWNAEALALTRASEEHQRTTIAKERAEAVRRLRTYRGPDAPQRTLRGKTVVIVDDGIATGVTMAAASRTAHTDGAQRVILAVPVAATDSLERLRPTVDDVVCLDASAFFESVGASYREFPQVTDEEVIALLHPRVP